MPKSKNRKGHQQKVNARRTELENKKNSIKKKQTEFFNELIRQEKEKGLFENNDVINGDAIIL